MKKTAKKTMIYSLTLAMAWGLAGFGSNAEEVQEDAGMTCLISTISQGTQIGRAHV